MAWAELCCQSAYSLLHGASLPADLVETASALGIDHLAITDRDGVYGLPRAHKAAKDAGLHLICGASLTVEDHPGVVVLAQDLRGWGRLCRWLTDAHHRRAKGRASLLASDLLTQTEGLLVLLRPGWTAARADPLRQAFGDRLGVLVFQSLSPGDARVTHGAVQLGNQLDAPLIASNDVLYHEPHRRRVADVLTCIRRGCTLAEAGRVLGANAERHLLSEVEVRRRFMHIPGAVDAAVAFAERCAFSLSELAYSYPREVVPDGHTAMSWLRELTHEGLGERYPDGAAESVLAQVQYELNLVEKMNFPSYFLTVNDIVRFARSRGILCQGRGSAANSAVCYALGITAVDPSRTTLLFERFISEERGEPPDIDVDFEHERREEVLQYVYERYGRERAALVNEVIAYRGRSAIREVGKVMGLSLDQVGRLARANDRWSAGADAAVEDLVAEAGLDYADPGVQRTLELAEEITGLPRHLSIHVGGFVIAAGSLVDLVPVEPASMADRTVVQWDKYDIEALRFVKVDCLALGMLTAIRKSFDFIALHWDRPLTLATVPAEDPAVYDMFCAADTVGVFQIESRAQQSMLPRLRPRCFYDLVIEVAIVRPGPIQGGMVHPYLRRRRGEEPITYAHPALRPVLERTLGVPLFQEQVMKMAVEVGGFSPGEADGLRRAMAAWRKKGNLDGLGRKLVVGMKERGINEEFAEQIFSQIQGFGEYGFPESHAASFALLVYVSGWLKRWYPEAFTASLINSHPMGFYSPRALLADAQRHGVEVRPVCVVRSEWDCTLEPVEGDSGVPGPGRELAIRCGFRLVKGLGEEQGRAVVKARMEHGFLDVPDLARRTLLDRGSLEALAEADAFMALGVGRRKAAWILQGLWTDLPLFAGLARHEPEPNLPNETAVEKIEAAYKRVGLSVDTHPMQLLRPQLDGIEALDTLVMVPNGRRVSIAGLVANRQRPGTAKGVVFMTLEDETALVNLVIWPKVWAEYRKVARNATLLGVDGRLQRQDEAMSVLVERFWAIPDDALAIRSVSRDFH
ncbi:MAG: error-prone DNA polymerase [Myxococcota bacterium]